MSRILVNDIHFSYTKDEEILKGISLEFNHESTAIIGQNGAGKTTFVKLLKGLLKPTNGDILINNFNTKNVTVAELSRHIGLIFQNPNEQIFKSKVIDEVMFGPLNIMDDRDKAKDYSLKALEMVGLVDKIDENPYDLSLSERKLISIASILAMDTDIIIFDEPTIAQDYKGKERIKSIIKNLSNQGKLVLTIIHDMDFVAETFDRAIVFNQGQVLIDGKTRDVFAEKDLLKLAHLEAPHVTQLGDMLKCNKTFLTVEEFVDYKRS